MQSQMHLMSYSIIEPPDLATSHAQSMLQVQLTNGTCPYLVCILVHQSHQNSEISKDLDESIAFRTVDGQSNRRTSGAYSAESGSMVVASGSCSNSTTGCERIVFAFVHGKVLPQTELLGWVKPVECWLTCSLLAVHQYYTEPWPDLHVDTRGRTM